MLDMTNNTTEPFAQYLNIDEAIKAGNLHAVRYFLQSCDINEFNAQGKTPLATAIQEKAFEVMQLLLEKGANHTQLVQYDNDNILHHILCIDHPEDNSSNDVQHCLEAVEYVLNTCEGIDINAPNFIGMTVAMIAAKKGYAKMLQFFLTQEGIDLKTVDQFGWTALHHAFWRPDNACEGIGINRFNIVKQLCQHSIDINAQNDKKKTALMFAVRRESVEITRHLLKKGADINILDEKHESAFDHCIGVRHFFPYDQLSILLKHPKLEGHNGYVPKLVKRYSYKPDDSTFVEKKEANEKNFREIANLLIRQGMPIDRKMLQHTFNELHHKNYDITMTKTTLEEVIQQIMTEACKHFREVIPLYFMEKFLSLPPKEFHFVRSAYDAYRRQEHTSSTPLPNDIFLTIADHLLNSNPNPHFEIEMPEAAEQNSNRPTFVLD